ncbi:MAG TPA: hypothetical protein VHO70_14860, partial [Chitinispirillaceae bacterium]|nr:hypothetical protein [Chitinispirillaceae bacterium]
MNKFIAISMFLAFLIFWPIDAAENQKRDRGESFYNCLNASTSGQGNFWVSLTAVGHIWDNSPIAMDSNKTKGKWLSNIRAFPEIRTHAGLFDFATVSLESRVLGNFWNPGWISFDCKLSPPNNKELRFHGYALDIKYKYQFIESSPSLGGYVGFMPEGFVSKGHNIEARCIYELDLLPRISKLPLRLIVNNGIRIPVREDRRNFYQFLTDAAIVYSGYGFDFFTAYSIEAFNNLRKPAVLQTNGNKKIAVFFSENPMYLIFGGNLRYNNGLVLSVTVPVLLSSNEESKMTVEDLKNLNHLRSDLYPQEVKNGIKDPFDPWFVKWKIAGSLTFPIRYKMTSSELMRN